MNAEIGEDSRLKMHSGMPKIRLSITADQAAKLPQGSTALAD